MAVKNPDRKRLWARSGNQCSFPYCDVELVDEGVADRTLGEEAHIKGEKEGAARYDSKQSSKERDSYDNLILLCPTHHTLIDSNPEEFPVNLLIQMKKDHEEQIIKNRNFPKLARELLDLVNVYIPDASNFNISQNQENPNTFCIPAIEENGVNTKIYINKGDHIRIFASGLISFDGKNNFSTPEGILCNEYGVPFIKNPQSRIENLLVFPHPQAIKTDENNLGLVGSLIGWIDNDKDKKYFRIGTKKEFVSNENGNLYLLVNDAKGTYEDNYGQFFVEVNKIN